MYKFFVRAQLILCWLIYGVVSYKFWHKQYDPMFYDSLLFGRIPLFWFFHLVLIGILLLCSTFLLGKLNPRQVVIMEIIVFFTICIFLGISEFYFRLRPVALPLEVLEELGFNYRDKRIYDKIKFGMTDKYNSDPELGLINKPNLSFELRTAEFSYPYHTDSRGFQNFYDETLYSNADIVTLGDSLTEGVGAASECSYPRRLAKSLNERVLNLGHGSYDSYQYPIVLKRFGLKAHPKIVVASVWSWNDIQGRYFYWAQFQKMNGPVLFEDYQNPNPKTRRNNKSYMLMFIKFTYHNLFESYKGLWNYGPYRGIYVNGKKIPCVILPAMVCSKKDLEENLAFYESVLDEIKNLSEVNNFRFIVLYIPAKEEVYNRFLINLPEKERHSLEFFRVPIIEKTRGKKIEVFDLTPVFIDATKRGIKIYQTFDVHLTKEGYDTVASALAGYLIDNK